MIHNNKTVYLKLNFFPRRQLDTYLPIIGIEYYFVE